MLEFLRLQPTGQQAGAKKKGQKTKLRKDKNKVDGTSIPSQVISSQNELKIFMNVKLFQRGLPHEFIFYKNLVFLL